MLCLRVYALERLSLDQLLERLFERPVQNGVVERVRPGMFQCD